MRAPDVLQPLGFSHQNATANLPPKQIWGIGPVLSGPSTHLSRNGAFSSRDSSLTRKRSREELDGVEDSESAVRSVPNRHTRASVLAVLTMELLRLLELYERMPPKALKALIIYNVMPFRVRNRSLEQSRRPGTEERIKMAV